MFRTSVNRIPSNSYLVKRRIRKSLEGAIKRCSKLPRRLSLPKNFFRKRPRFTISSNFRCQSPELSAYSCKFPAIKDTNATRRAGVPRRPYPSDVGISGAASERFAWSRESEHACTRHDRSAIPSGMPERGLEEVILYRGEHVVARGASMPSTTGATTISATGARRRDDEGRRLQSSSCFGPLNSSWEMKPFLSLSSCWKISSTSLS